VSIWPDAIRLDHEMLARCRHLIVEHAPANGVMLASGRSKERSMTQYLLSMYQPDGVTPPAAPLTKVMQDLGALIEDAKSAGVWVFNGGLHSASSATVVRVQRGDLLTTDGPFVEGKEHIGGFLIVKASDLDAALEWARRLARALVLPGQPDGLAVEVRPFRGELER